MRNRISHPNHVGTGLTEKTAQLWMRYRVVGVPGLYAQLCQDPDAVGELEGLVEHVLAFHVSLGNGVDVVVLKLP